MPQERRSTLPPHEEASVGREASQGPVCSACGASMEPRRCKLVCRCGYMEDCGDVMLPSYEKTCEKS